MELILSKFKFGTTWYESYDIKMCKYFTIGHIVINEHPDMVLIHKLEIYSVFRNMGFGTKVLNKIIKENSKKIRLAVNFANTKAINFYKKIGFKEIGKGHDWYFMEFNNS